MLYFTKKDNKISSRLVKDEKAMELYHSLIGVWHPKQVVVGENFMTIVQHARLYFDEKSAKLEVLNGKKGIVKLKFEGRVPHVNHGRGQLEFSFPPLEWSQEKFNGPEPTLAKGRIIIELTAPPMVSAVGTDGIMYMPVGTLDRPYYNGLGNAL